MPQQIEVKDKAKYSIGIKIEAFRKEIRTTSPHKHNSYLELVYLSKGTGEHTIDTTTHPIEAPILFVIRQDQLHFWNITSEPEGFVLILKKTFADRYFDQELKYLFSQLYFHAALDLQNTEIETIEDLFRLLVKEPKGTAHDSVTLTSLLKALISKLLRNRKLTKPKKGKGNIFTDFLYLLSMPHKLVNNVSVYATHLHTTPQNLNALCRKETGKSASILLADHITAEATRLLLYTRMTVSQIAYQLNFKDNSHFSKYYKKHTGKNPSSLRR